MLVGEKRNEMTEEISVRVNAKVCVSMFVLRLFLSMLVCVCACVLVLNLNVVRLNHSSVSGQPYKAEDMQHVSASLMMW